MQGTPGERLAELDSALHADGILAASDSLSRFRTEASGAVLDSARWVLVQLRRGRAGERLRPVEVAPGPEPGSLEMRWENWAGTTRITVNARGPRLTVWLYAGGRTLVEGTSAEARIPPDLLLLLSAVTHSS